MYRYIIRKFGKLRGQQSGVEGGKPRKIKPKTPQGVMYDITFELVTNFEAPGSRNTSSTNQNNNKRRVRVI